MTLRLRLSLWYGALFTLVLIGIALSSLTISVRENYLTVDRVLQGSARLVEQGILSYGRSYWLETDTTEPLNEGIVLVLRTYDAKGGLMYRSVTDPGLPETRPEDPLHAPAPPAYLDVLPLRLPGTPAVDRGAGAFGTLRLPDQRWRRYVIEVRKASKTVAFVEALTPLGRTDATARRQTRDLVKLTVLSVAVILIIGWALAGAALRPLQALIGTARSISHHRDLSRRVAPPGGRDELGQLAVTFNDMLGSLESAWASQQQFVGDASHELRAPLTIMRANVELMRRHPHLSAEEQQEMLADMDREVRRMSRLVEDLLLLARSDAGDNLYLQPVDLAAVTREAIRDARKLAFEHTIDLQGGDLAAPVRAETDRLRQLLLILLDNALKYSPPASAVTVRLDAVPGGWQLCVQDRGPGIPAEALPHIFKRFYRADPARQRDLGAGLGLAIAEWIAGQFSARLRVARTGPDGTTFCVEFPALDAAAGPTTVPAPGQADPVT